MRKLGTNALTLGSSATWSARASGTDGRDVSSGVEGSPAGKSIPQESAHAPSLRICGVSRYRCRDHISRPGCGRILSLRCDAVGSVSGAVE